MNTIINLDHSKFKNKSILVAGGCGFLGSWICKMIAHFGGEVYCIDNMSTSPNTNYTELSNLPSFNFLKQDIKTLNTDTLPNVDYVFHFASRASPDNYKLHPIDTLETNSIGTKKLLEYSVKNQATFVFASTSEIYGDPTVIPTPESYYGYVNTMGVRSCYDEGKRYAEALIYAYFQEYSLDVRIVRIFNTYGPGIRPDGSYGRSISRFILQCLKNEPVTIYGDGSKTRSFNYVTDTISGIFSILLDSSFNGIPVNVGNDTEITILDLAKLIKSLTHSKSKIIHLPDAPDDPKRRCPDTSLLQSTGWKQRIKLREGLTKTIEWIRNHYV